MKNWKRRLLARVLAAVLLLGMLPSAALAATVTDSGDLGNGFRWELDDTGTLTITGSGNMPSFADSANQPWAGQKSNIKKVVVGDGITSIVDSAFENCSNLALAELPAGLLSITNNAFNGCSSLASIELPASLNTIGKNAFGGCSSLTLTKLPDKLVAIENFAFWGCSNLALTELPASLLKIGAAAFKNCVNLRELTFTGSTTPVLGATVFDGCDNLTELTFNCSTAPTLDKDFFDVCKNLTAIYYPENAKGYDGNSWPKDKVVPNVEYSITVQAGGGGTASASSSTSKAKKQITLTATPNTGYLFKEWEVTPASVQIGNDNSFSMPAENVTVKAIFEQSKDAEMPNITAQPQGGTYTVGDTTVTPLSVTASVSDGGDLSYQWYSNSANNNTTGNPISGATSASYTPPTTTEGTTYYYCVVTNTNNSATGQKTATATSSTAEIIVKDAVTPPTHTHNWNTAAWTQTGTHHWHECTAADCDITSDSGKNGYGAHVYDDDTDEFCNTCNYKRTVTPPVAQKYTVTVQNGGNGTASASPDQAEAGTTITLTATPNSGYKFKEWEVVSGNVTITNNKFTMPAGNVTVKAIFEQAPPPQLDKFAVTVNGSYATPSGAGSYKAGATVYIDAGNRSNYRFNGWTSSDGITFANAGSPSTTFSMPDHAVTVTATWTYTGGTSGGGGYTPPTYPPTIEGDGVTVKPRNPEKGETVTITPKPGKGYEVDEITVTDRNGRPVNVTQNPDGTYSFTQPSGKVTIQVTYKPVETPWNNPFSDVSQDDWYYEAVRFVHERGLMGGYGNGLFGPNNNLSRAQLAQILFNNEGRPGVDYLMDFSDVPGEAWYTEAVRWATSQGIVGGYGGGKFGPNDPITREQLAVMLWRYSGSPATINKELSFFDAGDASDYALEALRWAVENSIINGYGNGQLGPKGQATRAQVAQMLKNYLER